MTATRRDVADRAAAAFTPNATTLIGAEVELLVFGETDFASPVDAAVVERIAAGPLSSGGSVTIEPGGQLELVTEPSPDPELLLAAIAEDLGVLTRRFEAEGFRLVSLGLDPVRPPHRTLRTDRYDAMERHFESHSPAGLTMMNLTASLQINIDFGPDAEQTWRHATAIAPALTAAFANSPTADGVSFRPVSHRQRVWAATDPSRTQPVDADPADWTDYIVDALVIAPTEHAARSFGAWLDSTKPPDTAELDSHITTLFPPLRPRGYLELRMIDALPEPGRTAAIATVWGLLTDVEAGAAAAKRCEQITWTAVLELGNDSPEVHAAASDLLDIAAEAVRADHPQLAAACMQRRQQLQDQTSATSAAELIDRLTERHPL